MDILITGGIVLPMTEKDNFFDAAVGISGNRIELVSDDSNAIAEFRNRHSDSLIEIDAKGKVVMPGLINTHTHAAMTLMRGYSDDVDLMDWLQNHIWPLEGKLCEEDITIGTDLAIAEMLLGGTTSFLDMYHFESGAAISAARAGIRAMLSPFFLDIRMDLFKEDLAKTLSLTAGVETLSVKIAPHAPYTCSDKAFKEGLELAEKHNLGFNIHLNETASETPNYIQVQGESPVRHLEKLGLFSRPVVAAHCVYLDEEEMEILANHNVIAAHNPKSNMKLASGFASVEKMYSHGMSVSIGTDGAASNNNLDMWEEMRDAALIAKGFTGNPKSVSAYQALEMATVNGAKALGLEGELGIIKQGALADIIIVDMEGAPHHYPKQPNIISSLVYSCRADDVNTTIVNGIIKVRDHKLIGTDIRELGDRCTKKLQEIISR